MVQYGKTEDFILRKGEHMNLLSFFVVEIRPDGSRLRVAIKSNTVYKKMVHLQKVVSMTAFCFALNISY